MLVVVMVANGRAVRWYPTKYLSIASRLTDRSMYNSLPGTPRGSSPVRRRSFSSLYN